MVGKSRASPQLAHNLTSLSLAGLQFHCHHPRLLSAFNEDIVAFCLVPTNRDLVHVDQEEGLWRILQFDRTTPLFALLRQAS